MMRRFVSRPFVVTGTHTLAQSELAEAMRRRLAHLPEARSISQMVGFVYEHAAISARHFELDPAGLKRKDTVRAVNEATLSLAKRALLASPPHSIARCDALIAVSSSFWGFPSLGRLLQSEIGIPLSAHCFDLAGLGCAGPTHGLALAEMLVKEGRKKVAIVCADAMGTHGQQRTFLAPPIMSEVVAHGLSSDAAAAIWVSQEPSDEDAFSYAGASLTSELWEGTLGENDLNTDADNEPYLSVGKNIRSGLRPALDRLFAHESRDVPTFFHPGGAALTRLLVEYEPAFRESVAVANTILERHGNVGAPSLLLVLAEAFVKNMRPAPDMRLFALGPGIVTTALTLREVLHA